MITRRLLPLAIVALGLGGIACRKPCAPYRIDAFTGKEMSAFMADSGLRPLDVREVPDGKDYRFEVQVLAASKVPPSGPARPQNIENTPQPLQMGPGNGGAFAFQPARVVPGTPAPTDLRQVPEVANYLLTVRTGADGIILGYVCNRKP